MKELGFKLYLLFMASWFLRFPDRIPFLGVIRFDLILVITITTLIIFEVRRDEINKIRTDTDRTLIILIIYIILTIPLVQWPGSVVRFGIPNYIKGVVFFFFTVYLVNSEKKLKILIGTFLACQSFRIFEPLYLHITEGYWGSKAMMSNWEFINRLSGAPHDIINPNGLAFVIVSVIPFFYYLASLSWKNKIIFLLTIPPCIYALVLTESRSGIIVLIAIYAGVVLKSRKKTLLTVIGIVCAVMLFVRLPAETRERYMSIIDPTTKHSDTARGRIEGMKQSFGIALERPLVGHGVGTNGEATWNVRQWTSISHILYGEVAIELGYLGLIIFLFFMKSIVINSMEAMRIIKGRIEENQTLLAIGNAVQIYLLMNIVFSLASYGLSGYVWYLIGGLVVVLRNLAEASYDPDEVESEEYMGETGTQEYS
jgi:hypothetical protein